MSLQNLKTKLAKHGIIQVCKEGEVFTLLMTGHRINNYRTVDFIQSEVSKYTLKKYPYIEAQRIESGFILMVLKKSSNEQVAKEKA